MTDTPDIVIEREISTKEKIQRPKKYNVLFHNDDYTPMEFVTWVLTTIFEKTEVEAHDLMMAVHASPEQKAIVATFTKEMAEQKVHETKQVAELNSYTWFNVTLEPTHTE